MENSIITKFIIATPENIMMMHELSKAIAHEKFSGLVEESVLEQYITKNFNERELKNEMNSMSNQWLTVYYNNEPAGYARVTSKGLRHESFGDKRFIRLADYGILNKFKDTAVNQSLFEKSLNVCQSYEGIWLNEYVENPLIDFFEKKGFIRKQYSDDSFEFPLPSLYLVRDHIPLHM
jgi:hypothetical protein